MLSAPFRSLAGLTALLSLPLVVAVLFGPASTAAASVQSPYYTEDEHGHLHDHTGCNHHRYRPDDDWNPYPLAEPEPLDHTRILAAAEKKPSSPPDEVTADSVFSGLTTFAHLPYAACFSPQTHLFPEEGEVVNGSHFDIAIVGMGFDTGTSYRPGARFGPGGIRTGSKRLNLYGSYNVPMAIDPFKNWAKIVDCGDVPVTSYNNEKAISQMSSGHKFLMSRDVTYKGKEHKKDSSAPAARGRFSKDGKPRPRVMTLGGDHTITLPLIRSIHESYGPVSVLHFDAHLDTWKPTVFGGSPGLINHGTYFHHAFQEGLITNTSAHAGIRTTLSSLADYEHDKECGFKLHEARIIDEIGVQGIIDSIKERVGKGPVYLSIDIDTLDISVAPATGTPESGGWSSRELRAILRGLEGLNIVGADLVEVAPAYDTQAEITQIAAADIVFEVLSLMVKAGPLLE
jgi:agmatinase